MYCINYVYVFLLYFHIFFASLVSFSFREDLSYLHSIYIVSTLYPIRQGSVKNRAKVVRLYILQHKAVHTFVLILIIKVSYFGDFNKSMPYFI